ncbi:Putative hemagglutinin-related protein [Geitlerinema sp. FC II]|nr:Putative hemagglutinin-related protein [Geitlerinema sp. FC II]
MFFIHCQRVVCRFLTISGLVSSQILFLETVLADVAISQIVPDRTLPIPSQITINENIHTIEGGTQIGNNLFHSFESFSVSTGSEVFFNNNAAIENILARVTGRNLSNIDGLIRANGSANLLLINPNGLQFGSNARLDIGGSFLSSSADSIELSDGSFYSAVDPQAPSLLTVNVPVGLQLGENAGTIRVEGNGHGFAVESILSNPVDRSGANPGLQVRSGNTLALVGGEIDLLGGILRAPEGQVALGSANGEVSIVPSSHGWEFGYEGTQQFQDIRLSEQATVDVSGLGMGSIQLVGRQVRITEGSIGLIQNQGSEPSGNLSVNASELLQVTGTNSDGDFRSLLVNDALEDGAGGQIEIVTRRLVVSEAGGISAKTLGSARSGDISIRASESVEVSGYTNPNAVGSIFTITFGEGNAGNLTVDTQRLTILGGAVGITTGTLDAGNAGNLTINASESVTVSGVLPEVFLPAALTSSTFGTGNAGQLTINTSRLTVGDGAVLATSTGGGGSSGSVTINASDRVEVRGRGESGSLPARIESAGVIEAEAVRQALGLPDFPSGDAGALTINTSQLVIADGGQISVGNQGTGIAGLLDLSTDSILLLDTEGGITAATVSGEGGNIEISTDFLQLRRDSQITTEARNRGNGGNITIDTRNLVIREGSQINANAFEGDGGNINISAEGFFLSPNSDIIASSQFGLDGVVAIAQPKIDTSSSLVQLNSEPIDPNLQVVSACQVASENTFIVSGNGGLPPDPTDLLRSQTIWVDMRFSEISNSDLSDEYLSNEEEHEGNSSEFPRVAIVEATGWRHHENGTTELIAERASSSWRNPVPCHN